MVKGAAALLGLLLAAPAEAQLLFDGGLESRPDEQGWVWLTEPLSGSSARRELSGGATTLDTTAVQSDKAGWFANIPPFPAHPQLPLLDRAAGYRVRWVVQVHEESHASPHRAGPSVIVLSSDLMGLEIAHWADETWVQEDAPLFTHGEGALLDATAGRIEYELCVQDAGYRLRADGELLLSGELRDYSAFGAPYDIPDFLFFGDDTSSALGRSDWERFEVAAGPCGALPGDLHPSGTGDERLGLADFLLAHRKIVLGSSAQVPHDFAAGDLEPATTRCSPAGGPRRLCPSPDGLLTREDGRLVRALVAGLAEARCAACAGSPPASGPEARRPGDTAPRAAGGDAVVGITDVVLILRWAVGLDAPLSTEEQLRADIAPSDEGVVEGDGVIDVGDVLLALRTSVGLTGLRWPARELTADWTDDGDALAFALSIDGWPAWAAPEGFESAHCDEAELDGLDAVGGEWTLTCAGEPQLLSGPARLATIRYRAPEAVGPASLSVAFRRLDASLAEAAGNASLSAP